MDDVMIEMAANLGIATNDDNPSVPEPTVEADPLGNLAVTWPDGIQIKVNQIERVRRNLDCYLSVKQIDPKPEKWISAPIRINLLSDSAKTGLIRTLKDRRPLIWPERLDQVVVAVYEAAEGQREVGILKKRTQLVSQDWLLEPMLERNQHSMVVAAGGTGKSLLSLALFASVATGKEIIPGISPRPFEGNCLYLDWETDQQTHEARLTQMCNGVGVEFPEDRIHYIRMGVPLPDDIPFLYEYIIKNRIRFCLGDSVGMATGGDMNSQSDAIRYVNSVRALGETTFLSIHHVGWQEKDRNTGSRYFENAARSVWVLDKDQEAESNDSHIDITHRKSNNGVLKPPMGVRIEFGDPDAFDPIRYYKEDVSSAHKSPRQLIRDLLTSTGKMSLQAMYEDLPKSLTHDAVRSALTRMRKAGLVKNYGGGEWGIVTSDKIQPENHEKGGNIRSFKDYNNVENLWDEPKK